MKMLTDVYKLSSGAGIPCIGYGTWQTPNGEVATAAVLEALKCGYRHIDTAAAYKNEQSVGEAIRLSGIPREQIFITSKVWNRNRGYEKTVAAFERTLSNLGTDYLDLYLIHWPANARQFSDPDALNLDTWRALVDLYRAGRIRAIGVSNFKPHHLEPLMNTEVPPMVNQIELHPGHSQSETVEYCKKHGILVEAWSPLGEGRVLSDPTLRAIGEKYGKSTAQVCIRWCLECGALPLPKTVTPSRMAENADVFDFSLSDEDMATIAALEGLGFSGHDPDFVDF